MDIFWATIEEFPNYDVSSEGDIINVETGKYLKTSKTAQGVTKVTFTTDNEKATRSVALIVASAFVEGRTILFNTPIHLDNDKSNNKADNLLWRPRWFALKYTRQFQGVSDNYLNRPVQDVETGQVYADVLAAAMIHGLLMRDIFRTVHRLDAGVFPTWQTFSFIN